MPTILDLCDLPIPEGLDGRSFKAHCYGQSDGDFSHLYAINFDGRMLRYKHYKYIHSQVYGTEYHILFDLEQDPHETINLFGQPGYEAISIELQTKLDNWLKQEKLELTFNDLGD
jgi:arylsulfatase A-like enzyme